MKTLVESIVDYIIYFHFILNKKHFMKNPVLSPEDIPNRLKEFMKKNSLTGKDMARHAGITGQAFSGYMTAKNLPAAVVLATWSLQLSMNINWLLTGEGEMHYEPGHKGRSARDYESEIARLKDELIEVGRQYRLARERLDKYETRRRDPARTEKA